MQNFSNDFVVSLVVILKMGNLRLEKQPSIFSVSIKLDINYVPISVERH